MCSCVPRGCLYGESTAWARKDHCGTKKKQSMCSFRAQNFSFSIIKIIKKSADTENVGKFTLKSGALQQILTAALLKIIFETVMMCPVKQSVPNHLRAVVSEDGVTGMTPQTNALWPSHVSLTRA